MTSPIGKFTSQSGSAARHIVVLLTLGIICYFGVQTFYSRLDSRMVERLDRPEQEIESRITADAPVGEMSSELDKEVITARNLFLSVDRQGDQSTVEVSAAAGEDEQPDLLLVGTIVESGGANRAVVLDVENNRQMLLREGDIIGGASIRQIKMGRVIISRQGRNELLDIAESAKVRATLTGQGGGTTSAALTTVQLPAGEDESEEDEGAEKPLRIDLQKLDKANERVLVKGRISENI